MHRRTCHGGVLQQDAQRAHQEGHQYYLGGTRGWFCPALLTSFWPMPRGSACRPSGTSDFVLSETPASDARFCGRLRAGLAVCLRVDHTFPRDVKPVPHCLQELRVAANPPDPATAALCRDHRDVVIFPALWFHPFVILITCS